MGSANTYQTDLYGIHNYVQNTLLIHPKEAFIELLRDFFSQDSYFHYTADQFGFPKTVDQTDLPLDAGINDDVTTRLFIGEPFRYDVPYYPSLLIRSAGSRFVPISFNNNKDDVHYSVTRFVDGYGNESFVSTPSYIVQAGAWEGTINIDVETKSHRSRDELVELVSLYFIDTCRWELQNSGVFIKGINISAPSETDDRTDKLFKQTVSCEIRSEWRRHIPISNIVDAINICVDFGNLGPTPPVIAPNIRVTTMLEFSDSLSE